MFTRNLRRLRINNHYTRKALAALCGVSPATISYYEQGLRRPNPKTLAKLAEIFQVTEEELVIRGNARLKVDMKKAYTHFRIASCTFEDDISDYFALMFITVARLGGKVWKKPKAGGRVQLAVTGEETAQNLRRYLKLPQFSSIPDLVELAERMGILVYISHKIIEPFDSLYGKINNIPFIAIHDTGDKAENRLRLARSLVDYFIRWPEIFKGHKNGKEKFHKDQVNKIAKSFLFPAGTAERELGVKRSRITQQMYEVAEHYGISLYTLVEKAEECGIISSLLAKNFYTAAHKNEVLPRDISLEPRRELPMYFSQLVYRAVSERLLTIKKGASLLRIPEEDLARANRSVLPNTYPEEEIEAKLVDQDICSNQEVTHLATSSIW